MKKPNISPKKILAAFLLCLFVLAAMIALFHQIRQRQNSASPETSATFLTTTPAISFPVIESDTISEETNEESDINDPIAPPVIAWEPVAVSNTYSRDGEALIFASINQPFFAGGITEATEKINTTLSHYCQSFVKITSEDKLLAEEAYEGTPLGFEPHERAGDYTVFVKDATVSILFNLYRTSGGADSQREYKAFAFDLFTGNPVTFADFIGKEEDYGKSYILSVFRQMIRNNPDNYYTDALDILESSVSLTDFYLEEEALILFVNSDVLAPSAHGILTITIAYSLLGQ